MNFLTLTCSFFALNALLLYIILYGSQSNDIFWKTIHRDKKIGFPLGAIAMAWAGYSGYNLLGEDFPAISQLIPYVFPILIIGIYLHLDYVFTRCFAGLGLIIVCEILNFAIGTHITGRPIFTLSTYAIAIAYMFMVGHPWRFRDIILKCRDSKSYRQKAAFVFTSLNLSYLIPAIISYV